MEWLKERVWQLGIAVALVLVGAVAIYLSAAAGDNEALMWLGLALVFAAMLIPLAPKVYQAARGEGGEEGDA